MPEKRIRLDVLYPNLWKLFLNSDDKLVKNNKWVIYDTSNYRRVISSDFGKEDASVSKETMDNLKVVAAYYYPKRKTVRVYVTTK
jgi:hypothetical protein